MAGLFRPQGLPPDVGIYLRVVVWDRRLYGSEVNMINLILPLPTALNATYRTGKGNFYKSSEAKAWETEAFYDIKRQYRGTPVETPCYVGIEMFLKRDRDIDSSLKVGIDILQKAGVIKNDGLITHLNVKKYKDKNPRMEVCIERL